MPLRRYVEDFDAKDWFSRYGDAAETAWLECERGDWLIEVAANAGVPFSELLSLALPLIEEILSYLPEHEPRPGETLAAARTAIANGIADREIFSELVDEARDAVADLAERSVPDSHGAVAELSAAQSASALCQAVLDPQRVELVAGSLWAAARAHAFSASRAVEPEERGHTFDRVFHEALQRYADAVRAGVSFDPTWAS